MIQLLMDTSNQYLMVALYNDDVLLEKIEELGSQRQSENAIPDLEKILNSHHLELFDVDECVVTRGPGSYTGERVALTVVKTLNVIHPMSVKVVSSLASYTTEGKCISVIDARSHKVFLGVYEDRKPVTEDTLMTIDEAKEYINSHPDYKVVGYQQLVDQPSTEVDLAFNMHEIAKETEAVEVVDALVPAYLKDVEAKKICK